MRDKIHRILNSILCGFAWFSVFVLLACVKSEMFEVFYVRVLAGVNLCGDVATIFLTHLNYRRWLEEDDISYFFDE